MNKLNEDQKIALNLLIRHDHNISDSSPLTRVNCGACILNGYHPKGEARDSINYAGWARVYIQALKPIPANLFMAFLGELASDNRPYADSLRGDIKAYGIKAYGKGSATFLNTINDILGIYNEN